MIKTLIVMTTYGQIYFSKEFGEKEIETDISLTAGLISAVYSMTTETEGEKIENLDLQNVRTIFKEREGDLLFVLTLDKRMDQQDAQILLDELILAFKEKYGDKLIDGMILTDFQDNVEEVVKERLWYNNVEQKADKVMTPLTLFSLMFCAFWYPMLFLSNSQRNYDLIKINVLGAVPTPGTGLATLAIMGVVFTAPGLITILLMVREKRLLQMFRFFPSFIGRPTRGAYAEILPWWYSFFALISASMFISVVIHGRGFFYHLRFNTLSESSLQTNVAAFGFERWWLGFLLFEILILLTYLLVQPLLIGVMTGNLNRNYMNTSTFLAGMALLILVPTQVLSGTLYQELMGFNPQNEILSRAEQTSLQFLLLVALPIFLTFFVYIYVTGIGFSRLIKKNPERYPIAFAVSLFTLLALQLFLFWLFFQSRSFIFDRVIF